MERKDTMSKKKHIYFGVLIVLLIVLSCNLPAPANTPPAVPTIILASQSQSPIDTATAPPAPPETPTYAATHLMTPNDVSLTGNINYDVDTSGTGAEHRTTGGESYDFNLFERPFTQSDMTYVPNLDITTFQINTDGTWYYVFIHLVGSDPNDPINIDYGVELNKNKDGFGDTLVWAQPPYTTTWSTNGVKVYTDPDHDTGGASPEKSDANATTNAPYPGDGYETVIFDHGKGDDPDLAWVRINPNDSSILEFAFKTSLAGKSFMWGVWADAGLKDPSKFNYNDRFTFAQAGSPMAGNANYPIKAIYAVDNTCWAAYGFKTTGYEPHICPSNPPPAATNPPKACQAPPNGCPLLYLWNSTLCKCVRIPIIVIPSPTPLIIK